MARFYISHFWITMFREKVGRMFLNCEFQTNGDQNTKLLEKFLFFKWSSKIFFIRIIQNCATCYRTCIIRILFYDKVYLIFSITKKWWNFCLPVSPKFQIFQVHLRISSLYSLTRLTWSSSFNSVPKEEQPGMSVYWK